MWPLSNLNASCPCLSTNMASLSICENKIENSCQMRKFFVKWGIWLNKNHNLSSELITRTLIFDRRKYYILKEYLFNNRTHKNLFGAFGKRKTKNGKKEKGFFPNSGNNFFFRIFQRKIFEHQNGLWCWFDQWLIHECPYYFHPFKNSSLES